MGETGCEVICGAQTTFAVKGQVKVEEVSFLFGSSHSPTEQGKSCTNKRERRGGGKREIVS